MSSHSAPTPIRHRLLRRKEVLSRIGLGQTALYQLVREGKFPAPIPVSVQAVAWLEAEVDAWIQQRIEERDRRRPTPPQVMRF